MDDTNQGIVVSIRALTVFFWGCLIAAAAVAGEEHETRIEIAVDGDGDEPRVFEWHSNDPDADLSGLDVGESKTLTGDDGKEVVVTRTEKGLEFNVDGETINVLGDADGMLHEVHKMDGDNAVFVKKSKDVKIIETHADDGVTIIASDEIDDETRARIEAALKDSGNDGDVIFLDGSDLSGAEQTHDRHEKKIIIRKEIKETTD